MKPLSAFKYVLRNKKKVMTIILSVCFGVFLVYFPSMVINQTILLVKNINLKPYSIHSYVYKNKDLISEETIAKIKSNENVAEVIPAGSDYLNLPILLGNTSCETYFLNNEKIAPLMKKLDLKLIEGRLPKLVPQEIIIHKKFALSKGLKLNDMLFDNVKIVGIMDGPSVINFASNLYISEEDLIKRGMIVIAKKDKINELNKFLDTLPLEEVKVNSINSLNGSLKTGGKILSSISLILELLVIIVLSITLGNISFINIHNRKRELGILLAMGYTKNTIYKKLMKEAIICSLLGYVSGILVTISTGWTLNAALLSSKGFEVPLWDTGTILLALLIPVFVTIFSLIPAAKALKNTDLIDIVEGVNS